MARASTFTSDKWGYYTSLSGLGLLAAQSGVPSPLFPLYSEQWGLSSLQVSIVFAVYIIGLLITLLTTGALSDHIGRRPVAITALGVAALALIIFATANGFTALVVARILQGVASGLGFGTLGAALLDYSPAWTHGKVAMINGALPPVLLGSGALLGGILVQFAPHPFQLSYIVVCVCLILALGAACFLKERHPRRPGALRSLTPSITIPVEVRKQFFVAVGALCASWALTGLYLGMGPNISKSLMHITSPALSALTILAMTGSGAITGLFSFRLKANKVMTFGIATLVVGVGAIVLSVYLENVALYYVASIIGGIGFGASFQGGLRTVIENVPAIQRGSTLSSVYLFSYLAFGLPTLIGGLLVPTFGLKFVTYCYAGLVIAFALIALLLVLGSNPRKDKATATG